jgi:hypothetical protein
MICNPKQQGGNAVYGLGLIGAAVYPPPLNTPQLAAGDKDREDPPKL